ncbi:MAG: L-fucose:H+ symporter permease [Terriglobia bacterium]
MPAVEKNTSSEHPPRLFAPGNTWLFVLVTALFFLWALPNNLNDILIKQFMDSFALTRFKAGLVQSAFYMGYFLLSMPAALLMRKYGYKTGLVTGLFLFSAGAFLFWPAAIVRQYSFFLFALFVIASGLAFLETGANPFIATLGDPRTAERRLNFSQAFNPLGSVTGVVIGTVFIFSGIELTPGQVSGLKAAGRYTAYQKMETMRIVTPYIVIAIVVFICALLMIKTKFPKAPEEKEYEENPQHGKVRDLFHIPHFVLGVLAQFFYVGAQVGTWSYFIQYIQDYTHQPEKMAGYFLTGTLVAFGVGRFTATYFMKFIRPNVLMGIFGLINVALVAVGVLLPGWVGVWAVLLTSFFMSLMYPTIFVLAIKGLGANTKMGGSMIVMGIVGGAVATPVMALVYEWRHSMAAAMIVPLVCYAFITHYSFYGSRVRPSKMMETA